MTVIVMNYRDEDITCLPELSVSEDRYNDQQVAQNIYYNRSDENTGE